MRRTRWNSGYIPPTAYQINKRAEEFGIDTRAVEAVQDMAVLFSGQGNILSAEELRASAHAEARARPLRYTERQEYMVPETGEVYKKAKDARARQEEVLFNYNMGMRDFMVHASAKPLFKGVDATETALYTFKAMRDALPEFNMEFRQSGHDEMAMFGQLGMNTEFMRQMMQEQDNKWESLKSLDKWERAMLLGSDIYSVPGERDVDVDDTHPDMEIEIAKVLNSDMRAALRVSRKLRLLSNLNNPSFSRWKDDPAGPEIKWRPMKSMGEMSRMRQSSYAFHKLHPNMFKKKLVNNEFLVRSRGINRDNQQLLYVLIDGSGSMQGPRVSMAAGALLNRLRSVIRGDAQLYYRMFDNRPHEEHSVMDVKEAFTAARNVIDKGVYSGGGTNINGALTNAIKSIKQKMEANPDLVQPEIMLISDGEDAVDLTYEELSGIRLHVIMCDAGKHARLKKLSAASRGAYAHID